MEEYLCETQVIQKNHPAVAEMVSRAVGKETDSFEKARKIFLAVRDGVTYDPYTHFFKPKHYSPAWILEKKRAFCVPKAVLLCAACRNAGIPARLGFANLRNRGASELVKEVLGTDLFAWHGFGELYLNGKWLKATPSFDKGLCERQNIEPLDIAGGRNAVFPDQDLDGNPYAEYVEFFGSYADLPLKDIMEGWKKVYGEHRIKQWEQAFDSGEAQGGSNHS